MASAELAELIAAKRAAPYRAEQTIAELREASEAGGRRVPLPDGSRVEAVQADGVPCAWIDAPAARPDRVFLFFHGGGYYRGSVAASQATAAHFSAACGARCLSVDYRLAPEHPFPAAVDDAQAAYGWLLAQGLQPAHIVVGGISAGGGLCLALLLRLRAAAMPLPAAAVPLSAWTDLTQSGATFETRAALDPSISKAYLDRMAALYLAGGDARQPEASPLFGDLRGLPPMLLQVGAAETMLDDSAVFAERARAAGVAVCLETWEDMIHGWHGSAHVLPEARRAIARIGEFVRQHVG